MLKHRYNHSLGGGGDPYNCPLKAFTGFTMSEVLITLGILGVVIAMTLPGLIQRYQKLAFATQLKKSVNILENGFKLEMAKADSGELAGTELWQTFPASSKGYGNSFGSAEQYEATEVILKKLFNIMFIPHERTDYENHGDDYRVYGKSINGKTEKVYIDNDLQKIYFVDGSMVAFRLYQIDASKDDNCHREGIPAANCQYVGRVVVDVNGDKNPNTFGRDMFVFEISNIGRLIPWGSSMHELVSGNPQAYWKNSGRCGAGTNYKNFSNSDGAHCAGRLIENSWTFDY